MRRSESRIGKNEKGLEKGYAGMGETKGDRDLKGSALERETLGSI